MKCHLVTYFSTIIGTDVKVYFDTTLISADCFTMIVEDFQVKMFIGAWCFEVTLYFSRDVFISADAVVSTMLGRPALSLMSSSKGSGS